MLKSIDPLLNADVLYALRAMGHGDDLVICDTNFPADSVARQTALGRLLRIDGVTAGRAARAILSVLPLDSFVEEPALRMEIVGKSGEVPPVQAEVQAEIDPEPVIGDRAIDAAFRRGEIGELAAEPEAEPADFPGAFTPRAQSRNSSRDILDPLGEGGDHRTEHDIALCGIKMSEFAQVSIIVGNIGEQQEPRSFSR